MMAYSAEVRELTFKVWYGCSQNNAETARLMGEQDYVITAQTIGEWKKEYGWAERATRMDLAKQTTTDNVLSFEEGLFNDLVEQKARYDRYFESLPDDKVDTQAMYAYTQLCKQLKELHKEIKPKAKKEVKGGLKQSSTDEIKKTILGIE